MIGRYPLLNLWSKWYSTSDPFRDPKDPLQPKEGDFRFENDSDYARLVRG
jgi:hypothetical protein